MCDVDTDKKSKRSTLTKNGLMFRPMGRYNAANKRMAKQNSIGDHITVLHEDPPRYQCNGCMKDFQTKAHWKYHRFCVGGEKPYQCEQCGKRCIARSHLVYHLRTHTGARPFVCHTCGRGFIQKGSLTRHIRSHTGEKPYVCPHCGKGLSSNGALRLHNLVHFRATARHNGMARQKKIDIIDLGFDNASRRHACGSCSRAFSSEKDLLRHIRIHTGERPFNCKLCESTFTRNDNLQRHVRKYHNDLNKVASNLSSGENLSKSLNDPTGYGIGLPVATGITANYPAQHSNTSTSIPTGVTYWYMGDPEYEKLEKVCDTGIDHMQQVIEVVSKDGT